MVIQDIHFNLKDGREALICSPREEDINSMLDYLRISAGETEFIIRYPEECGRYTYDDEKAFFERVNASPNQAMLVCVVDGKVAGNCDITFSTNLKTRHRSSIGIALISEFWNQGIGTHLFQEMIRLASEREEVTQMELEYIEGNDRARHLYEKMGFRTVGIHPNGVRLKSGKFLNEYLMIREMKQVL